MAKADTHKRAKPSKKEQYDRFQKTARDFDIDDDESERRFEAAFAKIVPAKEKSS
jgi:hypothetical protein